jgi:4'-phosphopantetheinyl transferase superfamily protein
VSAPGVLLLDGGDLRARAWAAAAAAGAAFTSRSYRDPYALLAWHDARVGVDIERVEPCSEDFARLICAPEERMAATQAADRDRFLTDLWSGKEALAKALGDALDHEPARLPSPLLWRGGSAGRWRARRVPVPDGHVGWLVWERELPSAA